jgi:tetratricopeptide (TPR) repeat protein
MESTTRAQPIESAHAGQPLISEKSLCEKFCDLPGAQKAALIAGAIIGTALLVTGLCLAAPFKAALIIGGGFVLLMTTLIAAIALKCFPCLKAKEKAETEAKKPKIEEQDKRKGSDVKPAKPKVDKKSIEVVPEKAAIALQKKCGDIVTEAVKAVGQPGAEDAYGRAWENLFDIRSAQPESLKPIVFLQQGKLNEKFNKLKEAIESYGQSWRLDIKNNVDVEDSKGEIALIELSKKGDALEKTIRAALFFEAGLVYESQRKYGQSKTYLEWACSCESNPARLALARQYADGKHPDLDSEQLAYSYLKDLLDTPRGTGYKTPMVKKIALGVLFHMNKPEALKLCISYATTDTHLLSLLLTSQLEAEDKSVFTLMFEKLLEMAKAGNEEARAKLRALRSDSRIESGKKALIDQVVP